MLGDLATCAAALAAVGHPARVLAVTGSTNDDARAWAGQGAPSGAVVIAEAQTAGRGRHGRAWSAPAGATLAMSIVVRPAVAPSHLPSLSIVAGLAVRAAIARRTSASVGVKWPNDVVVRALADARDGGEAPGAPIGLKIAGILVEAALGARGVEHAIVGIGINVARTAFPPELEGRATSLARLPFQSPSSPSSPSPLDTSLATSLATSLDRTALAVDVVTAFDAGLAAWLADPASIGVALASHDVLRGVALRLEDGRRGRGEGVASDGRLRVRLADGSLAMTQAGEVLVDGDAGSASGAS